MQIGLYAAPLASIAYAMFGGSKLLIYGAAGSIAAVSASVVGGLSGGDQDTGVATHPEAEPMPGVIVYRFSTPLIFSNATAFTDTGRDILINAAKQGPLPYTLVIDFEEVFLVDNTGAAAVSSLCEYTQRYGVDLALARVHSGTHKLLGLSGVTSEIGEQRIYDTVRDAVDASTATVGTAEPDTKQESRS